MGPKGDPRGDGHWGGDESAVHELQKKGRVGEHTGRGTYMQARPWSKGAPLSPRLKLLGFLFLIWS